MRDLKRAPGAPAATTQDHAGLDDAQNQKAASQSIYERYESQVRSYGRVFPKEFQYATGSLMTATDGSEYLDFFAGAGALNYGHNDPACKHALMDYVAQDGIAHSLDMETGAKARFIETFQSLILKPRSLEYKMQFVGPTGTNAVEAALKLARLYTGRSTVVSFTNAFHGASLAALAVSGNAMMRTSAGIPLANVVRMPYEGYMGEGFDTIEYFDRLLNDESSGMDRPAAVIVETVQGEGGAIAASPSWLRSLRHLTCEHGILLIVDDIQAGVGRTGSFFSFEEAGIVPDIVTLSKSLSGYGLPLAMVLLSTELDVWAPGAHNGTFRGNNLAFVTATAALEAYWADGRFELEIARKAAIIDEWLDAKVNESRRIVLHKRGRGLFRGLAALESQRWAQDVAKRAFENNLIIETAGAGNRVLKLMPALTIQDHELSDGLARLSEAIRHE